MKCKDNTGAESKSMKVKNREQFIRVIKAYRAKGYNIITLGKRLAELEKDNEIITIKY